MGRKGDLRGRVAREGYPQVPKVPIRYPPLHLLSAIGGVGQFFLESEETLQNTALFHHVARDAFFAGISFLRWGSALFLTSHGKSYVAWKETFDITGKRDI